MAVEIEIKAKISDPAKTRACINETFTFMGNFEKNDAYWFKDNEILPSGLRIRKETLTNPQGGLSQTVRVTYKNKETCGGMEINDEKEFILGGIEEGIESGIEFEGLLNLLGFKKEREKRKKGEAYTKDGLKVELCDVEGLGWFVEIEILESNMHEETIAAARKRLFSCLAELGIREKDIETRFYAELLEQLNGNC
ncbi:MAG: class IV adenylate cyclase [Treponema sp.]|jgi:adenylate cyclase class 2|nr:class IV adenylate cyclase [Treponema sp.]